MILFTINTVIFCVILIYLVDRLINFFKENLTIPKTKDLINLTPKKYEDMMKLMNHRIEIKNHNEDNKEHYKEHYKEEKSKNSSDIMKEELKSFLKKQLNNNKNINGFENYTSPNNSSINFSLL